jgi:hypothetical protein
MVISREIFWDTKYENIDWEGKAGYVIQRVVQYGTIADWRAVISYYGKERIKQEMIKTLDLDPKSLSFISCIFNIPKEQFACYGQIQSSLKHWTY